MDTVAWEATEIFSCFLLFWYIISNKRVLRIIIWDINVSKALHTLVKIKLMSSQVYVCDLWVLAAQEIWVCKFSKFPIFDKQHVTKLCMWLHTVRRSTHKGVVYDSAESLLIFELNSQTIHPSLQRSFKHARALVCPVYEHELWHTEVFRGNAAKASVFDDLGWQLYPRHSVCFLFAEPGLCMNTRLFFQRTHRTES